MLVAWPFFLGMFVAIVAPMATGVILLLSSKGVGSGDAEVSERARLWSGAGAFTAGLLTVVFFVADSSLTFTGVPVWVWLLVLGVVLGWAAWSVYVAMKSTDA